MPTMPNLFGLNLWEAQQQLTSAGVLNVSSLGYFGVWPISVNWVPKTGGATSLTATPGIVVAQSVSSGLPIAANSALSLSVVQYSVGISYP